LARRLLTTKLVATPAPTAAPTLRMLVFIPVAIPVWDWGTASTTRLDMAAYPMAIPMPSNPAAMRICQLWACQNTSTT